MSTITVNRDKAGVEDIYWGTGTFERTASDGVSTVTIQKINTDHIPIVDSLNVFSGEYLTKVLEELYELYTDAHIQSWYYVDENGTILHGFGDVINRSADIEANQSFWRKDSYGTVIHGMGDVINR